MDIFKSLNSEAISYLKKHDLLKELVKRELIDQKINSILLNKEENQEIKESFFKRNNLDTQDKKDKFFEQINLTEQEWTDKLTAPKKLQLYCLNEYGKRINSRFLARKKDLDVIVYSLIRVKSLNEAKELFLRIQGKEASFSDLAKEFSQGPEKETLGVVGPLGISQGHPDLQEKLKELQIDEITEPFAIEGWWILLRLESKKEAILDKTMELRIAKEMLDIDLDKLCIEAIEENTLSSSTN